MKSGIHSEALLARTVIGGPPKSPRALLGELDGNSQSLNISRVLNQAQSIPWIIIRGSDQNSILKKILLRLSGWPNQSRWRTQLLRNWVWKSVQPKIPSKIDGKWNPPVLEDLQNRLRDAGLKWNEQFDWMVRGAPKLIEKRRKPPSGIKTAWTGRHVRERHVTLVDAINYASFLRSKAGAHASGTLTKHLTMVDVSNVQDLARQLTLRTLGHSTQEAPIIVI
jgi:hypothetical protein